MHNLILFVTQNIYFLGKKWYLGTVNMKFKFPALAVFMNLGHQVAIFPVPVISREGHPLG